MSCNSNAAEQCSQVPELSVIAAVRGNCGLRESRAITTQMMQKPSSVRFLHGLRSRSVYSGGVLVLIERGQS
jgi:hypothetical protein